MPRALPKPPRKQTSRIRERTRALLVDAAVRVFARKGVGAAAIHEIAAEAGVANGTFYNYFRSREELLEAASLLVAERLTEEITIASEGISDAAVRVSIGVRRFLLRAARDPVWAAALLRMWAGSPHLPDRLTRPMHADLRLGKRQGRFTFASESAAFDLLHGSVLAGMRRVLEGQRAAAHATAVSALVLRGLGVAADEADGISERPHPEAAAGRAEASG